MLSKIEHEDRRDDRISAAVVLRLARALDVDLEWLITGEGVPDRRDGRALAASLCEAINVPRPAIETVLAMRDDGAAVLFWCDRMRRAAIELLAPPPGSGAGLAARGKQK